MTKPAQRSPAERTATEDYPSALAELIARAPEDVPGYLSARSGLPGPRANLRLADAVAAVAPGALVYRLAASSDEFLALCGTEGLGRVALAGPDRGDALALLRRAARDPRWRVREGAARALQLIGDTDRRLLHDTIVDWLDAADPWLARAAVAAICEPRLLREPDAQAVAVQVCDRATALLLERPGPVPAGDQEAHRVLRQALGYGWSVAIAASPDAGLAAFDALARSNAADARWIVRTNLTKARLRPVLAARNRDGADR